MSSYVLDASAGVEFLLATTTGAHLASQVPPKSEWWVPEHYFVEVASALRRAWMRDPAAATRIDEAVQRLATAPIHRVQIRPLLPDAWRRRGNLTVADALYVVLAEHIGATLVTADVNLANAPNLGVATIHP